MISEFLTFVHDNLTGFAAIIGVVAVITKWGLDEFSKVQERRHQRNAAFARFYSDVRLRVEYLGQADDQEALANGIKNIREHANKGTKFRFYVAQVTDSVAQEQVSNYLYWISDDLAYLSRKFIHYDKLFALEYEKLQSDQFADLDVDRQIAAFNRWFESAKAVAKLGRQLDPLLKQPKYRRLWFS